MTEIYRAEIDKDQQTKESMIIYDRSILDLVGMWSSFTKQPLEKYEEVILWYLKHYPNFLYIITSANKENVLKRAEERENPSEADLNLINDLKNDGGKHVYEVNIKKNKEL
jgi:hypothetical protein